MTPRTADDVKELAHRVGNGIDVSLYWSERTNRVTVRVYDTRADEGFELEVEGRRALDAYRHPFAYATAKRTRRTIAATETQAA
jgi:hypothetical protein